MPKPIIKTKNLDVIYFLGKSNQVNALTDINLEIYPGEFIIFFGPSGCGKSTLLYSIAGLEKNIHGDVFIDNKNLSQLKEKEIDKHRQKVIGMIFQAYYLIPSLNVVSNVVLPQLPLNVGKKDREKRAIELLEYFGVKIQAQKLPNELSGGQQQRVAICRALVNDPEIILADEPTGNLDSKSVQDVMKLLVKLNEEKKKTIILVTHNPATLDYAHRVFYMKDGRLIDIKNNRDVGSTLNQGNMTAYGTPAENLEKVTKAQSDLAISGGESLLLDIKAKSIVAEALAGLSTEEIEKIEYKVKSLLVKGVRNSGKLESFLQSKNNPFGLAWPKKKAQSLSDKISTIVQEIRELSQNEKKEKGLLNENLELSQARELRKYLFDYFDFTVRGISSVERIDELIKDFISEKIDLIELARLLDEPLKSGGAGLDRRQVRKIIKHLKLLSLGKI